MKKKHFFFFIVFCLTSLLYAQSDFFKTYDGVEISYTDQGFGKPVLLIHGFINSRKSWDNTILKKQLLEKGYRVIVPDLRGNGTSGKPQNDDAYKNDAEVKDLQLLMTHLNTKKYYAIGYSRGSIVLAKLLTVDKRIDKAVLGGMGVDFTNPDWDRRILFMKAFAGEITEETKGAVAYAKTINADLHSLHLQQKHQPVTSISELKSVEAKILVIAGDKDLDNGEPKQLQKIFKRGKLVIVPGNHNGTYKTAAFAEAILKFL